LACVSSMWAASAVSSGVSIVWTPDVATAASAWAKDDAKWLVSADAGVACGGSASALCVLSPPSAPAASARAGEDALYAGAAGSPLAAAPTGASLGATGREVHGAVDVRRRRPPLTITKLATIARVDGRDRFSLTGFMGLSTRRTH